MTVETQYHLDSSFTPTLIAGVHVKDYMLINIVDNSIIGAFLRKRPTTEQFDLIQNIKSLVANWVIYLVFE